MRQHTTRFIVVALALSSVVTGSCKKKDATPSADTTAMRPANEAVRVSAVELGRAISADKRVAASTSQFATTDTIYASVMTTGAGSVTLVARWTFEDGQVVDESSQSISPTGPAVTEFHISKPSRWPAGKYKVAILLNGQQTDSKEFEVK